MAQAVELTALDSTRAAAGNTHPLGLLSTQQALHVFMKSLLAGERNQASLTNSYLDVRSQGTPQILNASGSALAIGGSTALGDTHLMRIIIHTALAGTLTLAGFADHTGAALSFVLPLGLPAGSYEFGHALNTIGQLTATLSSATDVGRVMVISRAA